MATFGYKAKNNDKGLRSAIASSLSMYGLGMPDFLVCLIRYWNKEFRVHLIDDVIVVEVFVDYNDLECD